jgi:transcriptional regulator of acetoin/glycerol metabolism
MWRGMTPGDPDRTVTDLAESARSTETQWVLRWVWPHPRRTPLQGARVTFGRGTDSDFVLESGSVSRLHAEIYRQGPLLVARDLGSRNGTFVDGRPIEHAPLAVGSVLRVGDCVAVVVREPEDAAPVRFREVAPGVFGGPELAAALMPLERAAGFDLPIVILGATGTGKERAARAAHAFSARSGPFFALNCAALPEHVAEAELFGYRRGAFTGAERASPGCLRAAQGGTLFLDEIADLGLAVQAKLLRALEERLVRPLGETDSFPIDVRIVVASQSPLAALVEKGRFRDDLHARLSGLVITLPALRERRADIAPLFQRFLRELTGGSPPDLESRLVEALCLDDWGHNVRGLEICAKRLVAVHGHEPVLLRRFAPEVAPRVGEVSARPSTPSLPPLDRVSSELVRLAVALREHRGNVKAAAASLGLSRQRVYRLLEGRTPEQLMAEAPQQPRSRSGVDDDG